MKIKLLAIFIFSFQIYSYSQAPSIQWQKTLGGSLGDHTAYTIISSAGGFVAAGTTNSNDGDVTANHGGSDCWVVKLSDLGSIEWKHTYGGSGNEALTAIQQTADGGYILLGYTSSNDGDVTGNHGSSDYWVVKLDATGSLVWQKTYGGTSSEFSTKITQTTDGGYILIGSTDSNDGDITGFHAVRDIWVVKIDANGTLVWQRAYGGSQTEDTGAIKQTSDGGYIFSANTVSVNGDITSNHGATDCWVVKIDNLGVIEWQKTYGGTETDITTDIRQLVDGNYIVCATTGSEDGQISFNHGAVDYWLLKLNTTGDIIWEKAYGGAINETARSILLTQDGGFLMIGTTFSNDGDASGNHGLYDCWVVKLNSDGIMQWQKCLGGTQSDSATTAQQLADGSYIIGASTNSSDGDVTSNHGPGDGWVIKLGPELGIDDFDQKQLTIYPNPTHSILNLNMPDITFDKIKIADVLGKTITEQTQNTNQINIENLSPGIYIIQAFAGNRILQAKFIKE